MSLRFSHTGSDLCIEQDGHVIVLDHIEVIMLANRIDKYLKLENEKLYRSIMEWRESD